MNIETFDFLTSNDVKSTGIIEFEDIVEMSIVPQLQPNASQSTKSFDSMDFRKLFHMIRDF
jgi:hypothetical protein